MWFIQMFDNYYPRMWWSKMTILKKSSHRMTKTFWETINEHPLRVSSQYRDHPLAYIAEQGFCGRIPRAIRYHRLIVLLSTMTDWSCCTQTRRYGRLIDCYPLWPTVLRSQTRHNTIDIHDSYIIFFEPKSRYHRGKSTRSVYQERHWNWPTNLFH